MTDDVVVLEDAVHREEEIAHFQAPAIQHNPDGWGPCELPDQFKDIPYQPFSKGDRLGKVRCKCGFFFLCLWRYFTYFYYFLT